MPTLTQNMVAESAALMPKLMWASTFDEDGTEDPFFKKLPIGFRDSWVIRWDQEGAPYGLIPQGTLDASPVLMQMPGIQVFEVTPGVYRGKTNILESYLTVAREPATLADPVVAANELSRVMLYFGDMLINRFRKAYADLGVNGQINNVSLEGIHHTYQIQNYQKPTVSQWSNAATATPIDDLRGVQTTANRGTSSRFGQKSDLLMVDEGINTLLATAQIRNSFRSSYGASFLAPYDNNNLSGAQPPLNGDQSLNKLFFGMGLPMITPWNHGYYPDFTSAKNYIRANFLKFIPNTSAVWLGMRPQGQQLGQMTVARHIGNDEKGDEAMYNVVTVPDKPEEEYMKGVFIRVFYRNEMPNGYEFQIGVHFTPEVWYDDAMLSVNWT